MFYSTLCKVFSLLPSPVFFFLLFSFILSRAVMFFIYCLPWSFLILIADTYRPEWSRAGQSRARARERERGREGGRSECKLTVNFVVLWYNMHACMTDWSGTRLNWTSLFLFELTVYSNNPIWSFFIVLMVSIYCNLRDKWLLVAAVLS